MYKIGVFDSGVGGLTVLKEIEKYLPKSHIIYFGDSANAPYGDKSKNEIKNLCLKIGKFLYNNSVDAIVIACNTATAASLEAMQETFPIPIIGVIEPGVKSALATTTNGKVAVIATPATVKFNAYRDVFDNFAPENFDLVQRGCKLLCPMVEEGWENKYSIYFTDEIIRLYLEAIPEDVDTLVLGCTHYPMIRNTIERQFTKNIVDPAKETTLELLNKLKTIDKKNDITPKIEFAISGDIENFKTIAERFLEREIQNLYNIKL
ncbi:MAG: glutamate racemase [Cetobacterium sp.]|uniref:glutamate racemase n=1 Tax=Cetobacterium sp. TaxID=2071632 RepID=UPI002FC8AA8E